MLQNDSLSRPRLLIARAGIALALLLLNAGPATASPPVELSLGGSDGQPRALSDLRGDVVVVNFWATWCLPCLEELPLLERLSREYEARGVRFIAASADDESTYDKIDRVIAGAGVTFEVWRGATTLDMRGLGLGTALPATAVVGRDGRVAAGINGLVTEAQLREALEAALSGQPLEARHDGVQDDDHDLHIDTAKHQDGDAEAALDAGHDHAHDHGHDHDHAHDHAPHGTDASLVPS